MSEARALVAALARVCARSPRRSPARPMLTTARLTMAALAVLAVAAPAAAGPLFQQGDAIVREDGVSADQPQSPVVQLRIAFGDPVCTGFYVGNKMIVTAGHCYFGADEPDQFVAVLENGKELVASLTYASDLNRAGTDAAILHINDEVPGGWTPDQIDCQWTAKAGDEVSTLGFPVANKGLTFSRGYVNGAERSLDAWSGVIPVTMAIAPGHSGSPVYHDGKVIGILVALNRTQPDWSYVQSIKPICDLLLKGN